MNNSNSRSWLEMLTQVLSGEPKNRGELLELLKDAQERKLLDSNALGMIEGILKVPELKVRDIMIPRSHMVIIKKSSNLDEVLPTIIKTVHSRFPVIGENKDDILGILLAKDLLYYSFDNNPEKFNIDSILRPALFIPESKRVDVLLQEFRLTRNHMAIVVDEYGGVTGLVTIEDVIEQIVGDIEDEHDIANNEPIKALDESSYLVQSLTPIEHFNNFFECDLLDDEVETIGGLVLRHFCHVPKRGETVDIDKFHFKVLRADSRRLYLLQVTVRVINDTAEDIKN